MYRYGNRLFTATTLVVLARGAAGFAALALALGFAACARDEEPAAGGYLELDVGLTAAERDSLRFLTEGSDLFPVDLLFALESSVTGKPFVESMDRYGFLPSPQSEANPFGLPIGWTTDVPDLSPNRLPYVGINCAACHTGQIEYRGRRMRIDGAPNLADIEALGLGLRDSLIKTLAEPGATLKFLNRLARRLHPEAGIAAPLLVPQDARRLLENLEASVGDETGASAAKAREVAAALQRLLKGESADPRGEAERLFGGPGDEERRRQLLAAFEVFSRYGPILRDRLGFGLRALVAIDISPVPGPGRDDPWGIIRNLLFETPTPLTAPTSIPHLFHYRDFDWYHADGNTTSVMQRNVAQAVALGAYVDEKSGDSTLRPRNVHRIEELWSKVESPAWPAEVFGPIDADRAARGEALFQREMPGPAGGEWSCADCHHSRASLLFDLETVGTDPNRALSFAEPLGGRPFDEQVVAAVGRIMQTSFSRAGIGPEEARSWEYREPRWRTTRQYVARRLDGVWATAPYLHNGSVPTLYELLLPAAQRPRRFPLGHREYDPARVGYVTDVAEPVFVFDVEVDGNSNAGHEFGAALSETERLDLVEYLKTL